MKSIKLLSATEYIADATEAVNSAKERVYLMSMIVADDPGTHQLIEAIEGAAKRELEVQVAADTFEFGEFGGHFSLFKRVARRSLEAKQMAKKLISAGASFVWLGGGRYINPFAGVNHIKFMVVDDCVYAFGGVNVYQKGVENLDFMLRFDDPALADLLIREYQNIVAAEDSYYEGVEIETTFGSVLIDSGQRGKSIIYNQALALAKEATSIVFVSQYCPTGGIDTQLKRVNADTYFNLPHNAGFLSSLLIRANMRLTGLTTAYTKSTYLHAKFMICTDKHGNKTAITGSHNFAHESVRLGTREIALRTTNHDIISYLERFVETSIV